jgi:hypothetical protein
VFGALPQLELQLSQIPSREMALLQLLQHRASPVLGKDGVARWWAYRRGLEKLLRKYPVVRRLCAAHCTALLVSSPALATCPPGQELHEFELTWRLPLLPFLGNVFSLQLPPPPQQPQAPVAAA